MNTKSFWEDRNSLNFTPFFENALGRLKSPYMVVFVVLGVSLLLAIFLIFPFTLLENTSLWLGLALIIGVVSILAIIAILTGTLYYAGMRLDYSNQTEEQLKKALRDTVMELQEGRIEQVSSPVIQIAYVEYDPPGRDVQGEFVRIASSSNVAVDMAGWTLGDESGLRFTFPPLALEPGGYVRVWTKIGANTNSDLYWGKRQAIWNNAGDCASLRDSTGRLVDTYCWSRRAGETP
jgi:hypothetical protein